MSIVTTRVSCFLWLELVPVPKLSTCTPHCPPLSLFLGKTQTSSDQFHRGEIMGHFAHFTKIIAIGEPQTRFQNSSQAWIYKSLQHAKYYSKQFSVYMILRSFSIFVLHKNLNSIQNHKLTWWKCESSALSCAFQLMGLSVLSLKSLTDSKKYLLLHTSDITHAGKYILT